jgi:hypothetical protein
MREIYAAAGSKVPLLRYSLRSARMGSTCAERRAGSGRANRDTSNSSA